MKAHWIFVLSMGCGPMIPAGGSDPDTSDSTGEGDTATSSSPPNPTTTGPSTSTSTTNATTTIGPSDSSSDDGSIFLIPPDGGKTCQCCDVFLQDCPDGEKCMPWANDGSGAWNGIRCSPITDSPGQVGDPCMVEGSAASGIDDCDLSLVCWNVDPETDQGTCVAMCTGDEANTSCEDPATDCLIANDGVLILCLPTCDPLLDACPAAHACIASERGFVCAPASEGAAAGDPCLDNLLPYGCEPGLVCSPSTAVGPPCDEGEPNCCTPYCDLSQPDPTAPCLDPGQVCASWWGMDPAPAGLEDLGSCVLP